MKRDFYVGGKPDGIDWESRGYQAIGLFIIVFCLAIAGFYGIPWALHAHEIAMAFWGL